MPGVLTGTAAVITAAGGFLVVWNQMDGPGDPTTDISGTWSDRKGTTSVISKLGERQFHFETRNPSFGSSGTIEVFGSRYTNDYEGIYYHDNRTISGDCEGDFKENFSIMDGTCKDDKTGVELDGELHKNGR